MKVIFHNSFVKAFKKLNSYHAMRLDGREALLALGLWGAPLRVLLNLFFSTVPAGTVNSHSAQPLRDQTA